MLMILVLTEMSCDSLQVTFVDLIRTSRSIRTIFHHRIHSCSRRVDDPTTTSVETDLMNKLIGN